MMLALLGGQIQPRRDSDQLNLSLAFDSFLVLFQIELIEIMLRIHSVQADYIIWLFLLKGD